VLHNANPAAPDIISRLLNGSAEQACTSLSEASSMSGCLKEAAAALRLIAATSATLNPLYLGCLLHPMLQVTWRGDRCSIAAAHSTPMYCDSTVLAAADIV
jgi:hypothetical protein